jgi:hypothetical protein
LVNCSKTGLLASARSFSKSFLFACLACSASNRLAPDPGRRFPAEVVFSTQTRWKVDNYNHLLEQPTLFYAVTLSLVILGASDAINTSLAWSYVALRIAHSLVQATTNVILIRFSIFVVSSIVLLALTLRAAMLVY